MLRPFLGGPLYVALHPPLLRHVSSHWLLLTPLGGSIVGILLCGAIVVLGGVGGGACCITCCCCGCPSQASLDQGMPQAPPPTPPSTTIAPQSSIPTIDPPSGVSNNQCDDTCRSNGGCSATYSGPPRKGRSMGSCFPQIALVDAVRICVLDLYGEEK
jgi:hypothetical protein